VFKYGAPTAPQCPNGVQIWGRAAPAVSKGVHHGLYHRTQRVRIARMLNGIEPGGFAPPDHNGTPMWLTGWLTTAHTWNVVKADVICTAGLGLTAVSGLFYREVCYDVL